MEVSYALIRQYKKCTVQGCTKVHNQAGHVLYIKWVEEKQKQNEELADGGAKKSPKGSRVKAVAVEVNVLADSQSGVNADVVAKLQHVIVDQQKKYDIYKQTQSSVFNVKDEKVTKSLFGGRKL